MPRFRTLDKDLVCQMPERIHSATQKHSANLTFPVVNASDWRAFTVFKESVYKIIQEMPWLDAACRAAAPDWAWYNQHHGQPIEIQFQH